MHSWHHFSKVGSCQIRRTCRIDLDLQHCTRVLRKDQWPCSSTAHRNRPVCRQHYDSCNYLKMSLFSSLGLTKGKSFLNTTNQARPITIYLEIIIQLFTLSSPIRISLPLQLINSWFYTWMKMTFWSYMLNIF